MKKALLASACLAAVTASPALAQHRGGGGVFGSAFAGSALGGAVGSVLGNAISQPPPPVYAPPPTVYVAPPPVIYERRPIYVAPAQHVVFHAWAGPGFACYDPEPSAVNRAICGSEDLSAQSLALTQAVYAEVQQTPYNAGSFRAEYNGFMQSVRAACAPYAYQQQVDCISGMLAHDRELILGRLTGPYAEEAARPVLLNVQLQQRLHDMGLLPGTVDGVYGDGTRRAIANWQGGQGRPSTGVLSAEEVAMLVPNSTAPFMQAPPPVQQAVAAVQPAPQPAAPIQQAAASTDLLAGLHEGMPYGLARAKLAAAGWQTQFFKPDALTDQDRELRAWFIDHHISEIEDCAESGCKMQFHNMAGRLLYVYTGPGSHASDAYKGAGPSVIAYCLDVDDIACTAPTPPPGAQQAAK